MASNERDSDLFTGKDANDVNAAIVHSREFLLTDIPLLNDLSQTLHEVVRTMPDMDKRTLLVGNYSIGDFRLEHIDRDKTGLRFGDSLSNGFQLAAEFHDIGIVAQKVKVGGFPVPDTEVPQIDVTISIPYLVIVINFFLQKKNVIAFFPAENGITLPSFQVGAKQRLLPISDTIRPVLPQMAKMFDHTEQILHDIADKLNPWFEKMFIKGLGDAINAQNSIVVPRGMDEISIDVGEGRITCSILFKELLLNEKDLWLKARCQWGAHVDGKPDLLPPPVIHPRRAVNEAEMFEADVKAFVDSSLVDQFLEVLFYVIPTDSKEKSQEIHLGTILASLLQHLWGWKAKNEELILNLRHTCEPPTLQASDARGLITNLKIITTLTVDTEADENVTFLKAEVGVTTDVVGPSFDPGMGKFHFSLKDVEINQARRRKQKSCSN